MLQKSPNRIVWAFSLPLATIGLLILIAEFASQETRIEDAEQVANVDRLVNVEFEIAPVYSQQPPMFSEQTVVLSSSSPQLDTLSPKVGFSKLANKEITQVVLDSDDNRYVFARLRGELYAIDDFEVIDIEQKEKAIVIYASCTRRLGHASPRPAIAFVKVKLPARFNKQEVLIFFDQHDETFRPIEFVSSDVESEDLDE